MVPRGMQRLSFTVAVAVTVLSVCVCVCPLFVTRAAFLSFVFVRLCA
jgi:hypothetical protein